MTLLGNQGTRVAISLTVAAFSLQLAVAQQYPYPYHCPSGQHPTYIYPTPAPKVLPGTPGTTAPQTPTPTPSQTQTTQPGQADQSGQSAESQSATPSNQFDQANQSLTSQLNENQFDGMNANNLALQGAQTTGLSLTASVATAAPNMFGDQFGRGITNISIPQAPVIIPGHQIPPDSHSLR